MDESKSVHNSPAAEVAADPANLQSPSKIDLIRENDDFGVDWINRLDNGSISLKSSMFRVVVTPAPYFGKNCKQFGFEKACDMAEASEFDDHDFGACEYRQDSLRVEDDGSTYMDLTVDPSKVRLVEVPVLLVDKITGETICKDGKPVIEYVKRKESWITVAVDQVVPDTGHFLAETPCIQRDRRAQKAVRNETKASEAAAEKAIRKRTKRRAITPDMLAALLSGA